MKHTVLRLGGMIVLVAGAAACGSPSKPSVTLTTPRLLTPAMGAEIANASQPITLTVQNATSTGSSPLTYTFEVATDGQFSNKVFSKDGVAADAGGQTSLQISTLPAAKGYYWHARAQQGSATGLFTPAVNFAVGPAIVIQPPRLASPGVGATVTGSRPTLTVTDSTATGPVGTVFYRFDVSTSASFDTILATGTVQQQAGQTSYTLSQDLATGQTYYWRVVATDPADGVSSAYSSVGSFTAQLGIDLTKVVYVLGPNIGSWAQTATITNAYEDGSNLCVYHTKLGVWPTTAFFGDTSTQVEGNQWVFMQKNGQWYGGAADWYRLGQACKGVDANSVGHDAFYQPNQEPLHSWVPQHGEVFGVASTTPARAWPDMKTLDQRTNVVLIKWP